MGASFHAPWQFTFAPPGDHTPLTITGLSLLRGASQRGTAEVTELQTGNTFYAGQRALGILPSAVATTYLAPLLAGAQSVTGWCFNTRTQDFEAGEWGLLDDADRIGDRAQALAKVAQVLSRLDERIGEWAPLPCDAAVLISEKSQAVELAFAEHSVNRAAADPNTGIRGSALVAAELDRQGISAALVTGESLRALSHARLLVAVNHLAWEQQTAAQLLDFAESGGTVLLDATSGRFDFDARLHRPWPGELADRIGMRSQGLQTDPAGQDAVGIDFHGSRLGDAATVRSAVEIDDAVWTADHRLTFASDSRPVLWERE